MTFEERFWSKVQKTATCWLWAGSAPQGYGQLRYQGKTLYAHRVAYELLVGPIPKGMQLDHVRARGCLHRHCVNPAHLEPVTGAENTQRAWSTRTCPQGHVYRPGNAFLFRGRWICHVCTGEVPDSTLVRGSPSIPAT